uniref:Centromere protein K n=1 Tax=Poecilia reticulata TaxID=8081 RepID=A0A3P9MTE0_POERE
MLLLTEFFLLTSSTAFAANAEILLHAGKDEVCPCVKQKFLRKHKTFPLPPTFLKTCPMCCPLQMLKLCSELEMVVSCCEAKRDKLRETKESGEIKHLWITAVILWLYLCSSSILLETKAKIQKMKTYQEQLMESLGDILEKHVPLPQDESIASKKKKPILSTNVINLGKGLKINHFMNTPHDPYVTIDHTFWPPYVEMLLRHGIAVRHQENNFKIRLETFF